MLFKIVLMVNPGHSCGIIAPTQAIFAASPVRAFFVEQSALTKPNATFRGPVYAVLLELWNILGTETVFGEIGRLRTALAPQLATLALQNDMRDPNKDVDVAETVDALLKAFAGTSAKVKRIFDPKFVSQSIVRRCANCNDKNLDVQVDAPARYVQVYASQSNSLATTPNTLEQSLQDGVEEPYPHKMWCTKCNVLTDQKLIFHVKSKTAPCMIVVVHRRDKDIPNFDATKLHFKLRKHLGTADWTFFGQKWRLSGLVQYVHAMDNGQKHLHVVAWIRSVGKEKPSGP